MTKKWLVVSISVALLVLSTYAFVADAVPGDGDASSPLHELQAAVDDLQTQIDNIHGPEIPIYEVERTVELSPGSRQKIAARCDLGDIPTGGGFDFRGGRGTIWQSHREGFEWTAKATNVGSSPFQFEVNAMCLDLPPYRD